MSARISTTAVLLGLVLWVAPAAARERVYYFHNDHLGTPQTMTDQAGTVVWQAEYEPFGKATLRTATITNNLRFPGQYYDAETGLHYNWHRDYDPETGRYLQADPIGLEGGLNLYSYGEQNPVVYIDPNGENPGAGAAVGFLVGGPPGAAVGAVAGLIGGIIIGDYVWDQWIHRDDKCASDVNDDANAPPFPGINDFQKDCSPGKRIVFIIPSGRHKGRTNVEQEYQCPFGLVTRHMIVTPGGQVVHDHFRPGPAKGNPND